MTGYELRIYRVVPERIDRLNTIFNELVGPVMPRFGITGLGYWTTLDRTMIYWIVRHDEAANIEANWARFHADPAWTERLAALEGGHTHVLATESVALERWPVAGTE